MLLDTIIQKSVHKIIYPFVLVVLLVAGGIAAFRVLPIDAIPDITNVQVTINTAVAGQTPDVIETNVTYPIENAMKSVPKSTEVRSVTRYGVSQVTVIFSEGTDIYWARQLVSEKLQSVELMAGARPKLGPISTGLGEIVFYALRVDKPATDPDKRLAQLQELRSLQKWDIIPRLMSVAGVNEVNTIGGYPKRFYVVPDPAKMARYGINFGDIYRAVNENGYNAGGGYIEQTAEQLLIQGKGIYTSKDDVGRVSVKMLNNFETITLADVATVRRGKKMRTGAAVVNGKEAIVGTVLMLLGENSRRVSSEVVSKIEQIRQNLPENVSIDILYDRSDLVNDTLTTVQENILYGAGLVIIFLFLLVGNMRAALITALVVPLSLLGTLILMKAANIPGSLMSLGAIDFGVVIDGAVIVMDSAVRQVKERASGAGRPLTRLEVRETVAQSTVQIRKAAGFGQLIIIVVFVPLLTLTGVEGKMFVPMAMGFGFALISSFVLSFTVVPALAGAMISGNPRLKDPILMRIIEKIYSFVLDYVLRFRWVTLSVALLTAIGGFVLFARMGAEFIPTLSEGDLAIKTIRPVNISPEKSVRMQKMTDNVVMDFDEVKDIFSRLGTSKITTDPAGIYHGDCYITLKPKDQWPQMDGKRRTMDELRRDIQDSLRRSVPGQQIMMSQPVQMRFNHLLEGFSSDIAFLIYGEDLAKLEHLGRDAAAALQKLPGVSSVQPDMKGKTPMLKIEPRMDVINRLGADKRSVLETVRIALGGVQAGQIYEGVKKFPIYVRLAQNYRGNLAALKKIPVAISEDFTMPLGQVADLHIDELFIEVNREATKRRAAVLINLSGEVDSQTFVNQARKILNEKLDLPAGYYTHWEGYFQNYATAGKRLLLLAPIALLVVFMLIYSVFQNVTQTFIIFLGVPFAVVGGILNLAIMGLPFSISAGIGFIAVSGIAVLNGVVLLSYYNDLRAQEYRGNDLVQYGAKLRLRPVMMTALTDMFGFLPMMLASGTGSEVQKPLAVVVVAGIATSTILTLFVMPILYQLWEKRANKIAT